MCEKWSSRKHPKMAFELLPYGCLFYMCLVTTWFVPYIATSGGHKKKHQPLVSERGKTNKKSSTQLQFHCDKCLDRGKHWVCENLRRGPEKAF